MIKVVTVPSEMVFARYTTYLYVYILTSKILLVSAEDYIIFEFDSWSTIFGSG